MRLAACTLSAVLLSGCSWLGMGGHSGNYGYDNYGYGYAQGGYTAQSYASGCMPTQGHQVYHVQAQAGCAPGAGYAVGTGGTHGAHGTAYGVQGAGAYAGHASTVGQGQVTTLGAGTPYGSAVGGSVAGGPVQTVVGQPIYVQKPYPAYYQPQAPVLRGSYSGQGGYGYGAGYGYGYGNACCGGGGALPFGLEAGIGTEFLIDGDIFPGEKSKPFLGGPGNVSELTAIGYNDAFKEGVNVDIGAAYDLNQNTTIFGQLGYAKSDGQRVKIGTVDNGLGTSEDLYAEFSDLEEVRLEGGVRRYLGHGATGLRPYVGATAGFVNTKDVTLTQSSDTLVDPALFQQTYVDGGWTPTASGVVGAEWQVGARTALGFETGIRWSDDLDTNFQSSDRISIPLKLRGRLSF